MTQRTVLDQTAAMTLIHFLDDRFGYKARVKFNGRKSYRGFYRDSDRAIHIAKHVEDWVVIHEYAHHLDREVNRPDRPMFRYDRQVLHNDKEWHSESFYRNLLRVIEAAGITDYPWSKEYKQLQRWAKRDGLV